MKQACDSTLCDVSHRACCLASLLCAGLLLLGGCSSSLESTITGTLTNNGQPVPLAQIVFHPTAGGPLPYAVTLDDGSYSVITAAQKGLQAGEYVVVVEAMNPEVSLPKMYGSVATSPLKYQIKPGKNEIDINLE